MNTRTRARRRSTRTSPGVARAPVGAETGDERDRNDSGTAHVSMPRRLPVSAATVKQSVQANWRAGEDEASQAGEVAEPLAELLGRQPRRGGQLAQLLGVVEILPLEPDHVPAGAFVRLAVHVHA